jgi:hypothetical protein
LDLKVVRAVQDLGIIKGATGPHMMKCDDDKTYLVKFADSKKAAINEFVGHSLARAVDLPVPDASLVEVPAEVVTGSQSLTFGGIHPGLHLGSEMLPDALDMGQFLRTMQRTAVVLANEEIIPQTVCHDIWILTMDRERDDNHLFYALDGIFRYAMVDFSHSFTGPAWTADSIEQGSYLRTIVPVHPVVANMATGLPSFLPTLEKIEAVEDSRVEEIVGSVPEAWSMSDEERVCLVEFLELRRGLVKSVLTSGRGAFPNWKD